MSDQFIAPYSVSPDAWRDIPAAKRPWDMNFLHFTDDPYVTGSDDSMYPIGHSNALPPALSDAVRARRFALEALPPEDVSTAARARAENPLDEFTRRHLVLPRGPKWQEAVSSAVLDDWTLAMSGGGTSIDDAFVPVIKDDVRRIHRQLVPLWRRRIRGSRVLMLEAPLGEELTLLDLVAGELRMDDLIFETAFDDPRLASVLAGLTEAERAVAMAWAHPAIGTWTEAARFAGAAEPCACGERVRRKLKRLGAKHTQRAAAALRAGAVR